MKTERVSQTVLLAWAGAVVACAVVLYAPIGVPWPGGSGPAGDGPPPAPGPAARAVAAAHAGAQASLPELAALITDREKWLRAHPGDDASWAALGAAYVERGARTGRAADFPRAERALKRSLAAHPAAEGNVDAQLAMGALANARGDFRAAKRWGEAAAKQRPRRWQTYPVLIDAYGGLGDQAAAGKAAERLRELRSGAPALTGAARVYRDLGWREDAAAAAQDAVALAASPAEKAACLARLGDLAWERGEPREAARHYGTALRLVPGHAPSLVGRARALAALGRPAEAGRDYEAALKAAPLPRYALEAGDWSASRGRVAEAEARYAVLRARAAEGAAHGVNQSLVLARYEADHGTPDRAVTWLRAEWARGHRSAEVADALGWALLRAGRAAEALPYARRATEQGPRSALFSYHRAEIERELQLYGAARRHLDEALRTNPSFSPLLAPKARAALAELGDPPPGGPSAARGRVG
ncbi:tetratricopeptide repeat protein [Streptomyces sp. NPDC047928]|uniref:tetratricopeptide repeat protein n=1 Tax=unclassified Streptomyces TaxID=2593676 RepID=UPI00371292C0